MVTSTGLRIEVWAIRRIGAGKVAENSAVWRSLGVFGDDRLDVVDEAHAQHLVGLVEHEGAHAR
jgi:hypothetical protein